MSDFVLSQVERDSPLWRKLVKHLKAQREAERVRNDKKSLDERETAHIRGRIAQLTDLLALDSPVPGVDAPTP